MTGIFSCGMRIHFINQFFWPDSAATSQLLCDVAEVQSENVSVTVLCGGTEYAGSKRTACPEGVSIWRVRACRFGYGNSQKLWSYLSFAVGALWLSIFGRRSDVTVTLTTPPLLGILGWIAQLRGSRHIIWEMDVYPDVAVELGVFGRGGLLDTVIGWLADLPRRRADGIIALGPCMAERLRRRNIGNVPIHVVHNWADGEAIRQRPFDRDGRLKVFYSGNMGRAHEFETLVAAVRDLDSGFCFRFSGGGPGRQSVNEALGDLEFCEFRGYYEREVLDDVFGGNDVGLVTQRAETIGTLVPSKVYGILAAGRGVLFIGPRESTVGRIILEFGVGWQVSNGDVDGLKRLLWQLRLRPETVEQTGHRARRVFEREFEKKAQVARILQIINGG